MQENAIFEQIRIIVEAERHQESYTREVHFAVNDIVVITNRVRVPKGNPLPVPIDTER